MTSSASRRAIEDRWAEKGGSGLPPAAGGSPIQSEKVVGFAKEAVFGTFVAPTKFIPCIPTIRSNQKVVRPDQARGTRGQVVDAVVGFETEATVTGELIPEVWSQLCACCFGSGSDSYTSVAGAARHAMTPRPQCPSLSYEEDTDVIVGEQVLARQLVGGIVDRFQLKATNQSIIQAEAQLIAQREITPATPGAPSNVNPSISTLQPMAFNLIAFSYKGASNTELKDMTLALMNHTVRIFSSNGKLYAARLVPTKREVTLSTNLDFLNTTFYNDWFNGVKTSGMVIEIISEVVIGGSAVFYQINFTLPGLRPMADYSLPASSDVIEQNLTWSATVAGANEISCEWTNSESGSLA